MLDLRVLREFTRKRFGIETPERVEILPLRGGLESVGIARVTLRPSNDKQIKFVVKPLAGAGVREAVLHRAIEDLLPGAPAPRVLGWQRTGVRKGYLFLEWIRRSEAWPWKDRAHAALVLRQLARIHGCASSCVTEPLSGWDYDAELRDSAASTTAVYQQAWRTGHRPAARAMVRTLERISGALPAIRKQLMSATGTALLHGDAHPGNVLISGCGPSARAVLVDWARARSGSPLEDVSSWLQTLGFWEPTVKQSHDTLFRDYLEARGARLNTGVREAYWLAGACNAMAGALRYHLAVLNDSCRSERERLQSRGAAADWLRILRRADVCWRG